jgi:hypothetical protein
MKDKLCLHLVAVLAGRVLGGLWSYGALQTQLRSGVLWELWWGQGSWRLFTSMLFFGCLFPGLPAVPEPHGGTEPLAASSPLLLCRTGLPSALPGAEPPVLHPQVSPFTAPPGSDPPGP